MARGWRIERSLTDHRRLLLALTERDADLAAALNRSIVENALTGLLTVYEPMSESEPDAVEI